MTGDEEKEVVFAVTMTTTGTVANLRRVVEKELLLQFGSSIKKLTIETWKVVERG